MKKIRWILFLSVIFFLSVIHHPIAIEAVDYEINQVDIDYHIERDGSAQVTERYQYDFDDEYQGLLYQYDSTGVFEAPRTFDIRVENESGDMQIMKQDTSEVDGTYQMKKTSNGLIAFKIFSPGEQDRKTLQIQYRVPHLITSYLDIAELNYRVIGEQWDHPLNNVRVHIHLPEPVSDDQLKAWAHGDYAGWIQIEENRKVVTLGIDVNPEQTFMEAHVIFPTALVPNNINQVKEKKLDDILRQERALAQKREDDLKQTEKITNIMRWVALGTGIISVIGTGIISIKSHMKYQRMMEHGGHVPNHLYELPNQLAPAIVNQAVYLEDVSSQVVSATMLDLIRRKHVTIEVIESKKSVIKHRAMPQITFYRVPSVDSDQLSYSEQYFLNWMFEKIGQNNQLKKKELDHYAKKNSSQFLSSLKKYEGYLKKEAHRLDYGEKKKRAGLFALGILQIQIGLGIIIFSLFTSDVPMTLSWLRFMVPLIGTISTGLGFYSLYIASKYPISYTDKGARARKEWDAFKQMLHDIAHLERARTQSIIMWEHYLVFGVLFNEADTVIKEMTTYFPPNVLATGNVSQYYGHSMMQHYLLHQMINQSVGQAVTTSQTVQTNKNATNFSGSGGGFGGGTSFGGGGGGGGGAF